MKLMNEENKNVEPKKKSKEKFESNIKRVNNVYMIQHEFDNNNVRFVRCNYCFLVQPP